MPRGTIKEYNATQGYGVVIEQNTGKKLSIYANYLNLKEGEVLVKGQEVEYEVESKRNEARAVNVRFINA